MPLALSAPMSHRPFFALTLAVLPLLFGTSLLRATPPLSDSPADTTHVPSDARPGFPARGVVWTPPSEPDAARRTLNHMADAGITAVRLSSLPTDETVLTRADSLHLRVFVDLPVSYVSAEALSDSLRAARPLLDRIRRLALRHPSLQAVGLARTADTSTPSACAALQNWTDRLHAATPPLRTYYVTPFPAVHDQCADAVDMPLLDVRDRTAPIERWAHWQSETPTVGLGALGTWMHTGAASGLQVPHSSEQQARHLEEALSALLTDSESSLPPVFVYRWQDETTHSLPFRRYGMHNPTGAARPVAQVLRGFYTDTQYVFAFPRGTAPSSSPFWTLILGWGLLALLGGLYAQNLYVRQTLFRYFGAHGFYRDAVRRGREVGFTENIVLLTGVGVALSIIGTISADIAARQPATFLVIEALPPTLRTPLATGLSYPLLAGLVLGASLIALLLGWGGLLIFAAQRADSFSVGQGLMLLTWPCWPAFLGMLVALVAASQPPLSTDLLGLLFLFGGGGSLLAVIVRVLRNYQWVTKVPAPGIALLTLASPPVVLFLFFTALATHYALPVSLLWHLATRT